MNNNEFWRVYILRCADNTTYTGCTSNLDQRLHAHNNGEVAYTSTRLPIKLVTYIAFDNKYNAYNFERYLKSGSGKAFAQKRFYPKGN
jgi:predicted GIY-YIG superfamily endonuclease